MLGVVTLNRLAARRGAAIQSDMKVVIGVALMLVAVAVAVRTFVTIRGLWDASTPARWTPTRCATIGTWHS